MLRDGMNALGRWRYLPIKANGQPGAARYLRRLGVITFRPFCLVVLHIDSGGLLDIAAFEQRSNVLDIRSARQPLTQSPPRSRATTEDASRIDSYLHPNRWPTSAYDQWSQIRNDDRTHRSKASVSVRRSSSGSR